MKIQLSDHFTYQRLIRFTIPSIVMMIFISIYGIVDGIFVSNFAGKTAFAAVNLIYPPIMVMGAFGFMLGTGGSALVAKTMGEGDLKKANRIFSMLVYVSIALGLVLMTAGYVFIRPVAAFLGAEGQMLDDCVSYAHVLLPAVTCFMLQTLFQSFFITAEKPHLGLAVTVAAGVSNMGLDALFIAGFGWGLKGAALATGIGITVGAVIPLVYFSVSSDSILKLGRTGFDGHALLKSYTNGISEMMSELSMSVVTMLYNFQLMRIAGENGVAAYGSIMYINFIFVSVFFGYSMGVEPVISYHYGAGNHTELKNLFGKCLKLLAVCGAVMAVIAELAADTMAGIFVGYDEELMEMTTAGLRIYAFSFLLAGINIFGSGLFTALNNGLVSAVISFLRTLVFETAAVLILPALFGIDGVWAAIIVAETAALVITAVFFIRYKDRYHYC